MKQKLETIASIYMGHPFRSRIERIPGADIPVIQMRDLTKDNYIDCHDLANVNMDKINSIHRVEKGDLLFRSRGQNWNIAIFQDELSGVLLAAPLLRVRLLTDQILPEYLWWYINQPRTQTYFARNVRGTTQMMISKNVLAHLEVFLPSLEKQKAIVNITRLYLREEQLQKQLSEKREKMVSATLYSVAKGE
ncbi:restriction endonuclease subunit S [bacterium]|nr:restriction endonuclease subunit S [bacterium]